MRAAGTALGRGGHAGFMALLSDAGRSGVVAQRLMIADRASKGSTS